MARFCIQNLPAFSIYFLIPPFPGLWLSCAAELSAHPHTTPRLLVCPCRGRAHQSQASVLKINNASRHEARSRLPAIASLSRNQHLSPSLHHPPPSIISPLNHARTHRVHSCLSLFLPEHSTNPLSYLSTTTTLHVVPGWRRVLDRSEPAGPALQTHAR
jgi:hypothetical protein